MIEVGDIVQYDPRRYVGPDVLFSNGDVGEVVRIDGHLCEVEALCGQCWWVRKDHLTTISLSLSDFKEMQEIKQTYGECDDETCDE